MVSAKTPARYRIDSTGASVSIGDLVLIYGGNDYSISGVTYNSLKSHNGYDGGYFEALVITENGNVNITYPTNGTADIIHTGRLDIKNFNIEQVISKQHHTIGNFAQLNKGDIWLNWDEDDSWYENKRTTEDWGFTGQYTNLYWTSTTTGHPEYDENRITRNILQAKSSGTLETRSRGYSHTERDAIILSNIKLSDSPNNLAANANSSTEIDVTWDSSNNPYYFLLERKRKGAKYNKEFNVNGTQRSYTDTDVSTGTKYTYRTKAATPTTPDFDIGVNSAQVNIGDLVFMYENGSLSGTSHSAIANMIGYDGGRFKAFKIDEKGQITINATYGGDIIYASRQDTTSINVNTKLWGQQNGTGTIITGLEEGDYVIQWDEDSHGVNEGGYHSYSGKYELLYLEWDGNVGRRVYSVKTSGDLTRTDNGYVETVGLDTTLNPTDSLPVEFTSVSNEDSAKPKYPDISVR